MFKGYDPERPPPYTQTVYTVIKGEEYVITYVVSKGPAGSISISSKITKRKEENEEESIR